MSIREILAIIRWSDMLIKEYRGAPPNSAANSLPTRLWGPIPLPEVWRSGTQGLAIKGYSAIERRFSAVGCEFLPGHQGEIEDYDLIAERGGTMIEGGAL
jgi:hypothetical protein